MAHPAAATAGTVPIRRPQDVVNLINEHPAIRGGIGFVFVALGGVLIDAYQAAMIGFGNKYIANQFGISQGLAATVNASVLVAALIGGLLSRRIIENLGQRRAFLLGMGLCTVAAVILAFVGSQFGFVKLVGMVYPAMGYLGFVLMLAIVVTWWRDRGAALGETQRG